jgi:hypothetical protein
LQTLYEQPSIANLELDGLRQNKINRRLGLPVGWVYNNSNI